MCGANCMCCMVNVLCCIRDFISNISCTVNQISEQSYTNSEALYKLYATMATNNPMSVAAEYPSIVDDSVVYTTNKVRFLDMLNPKMVVLFKGVIDSTLPVYFKDTSGYDHIVSIGSEDTQAIAKDLINNYPYEAVYIGNYIILNPTKDTETKNVRYRRSKN